MTRTVNGERFIDDTAKEVLRKQLWQIAEFCGVRIVTYAILSNHFHVLVRVPTKCALDDAELLRRYAVLYPKPTAFQTAQLSVVRDQLIANTPEAEAWRKRMLALMGDVSQYMKLLKQRFSVWFNKSHGRYGTLWSERFKSVLVQPDGRAMRTMAAYIDLNCVRAGLVHDPKDYRFCGYAEAVGGSIRARDGIKSLLGVSTWRDAQSAYRQIIFGTGADPRERGGRIRREDFERVMKHDGKLPLAVVLRCRVRYFNDGAILGTTAFIRTHLMHYQLAAYRHESLEPKPLPPVTNWDGLATLRRLRKNAFG